MRRRWLAVLEPENQLANRLFVFAALIGCAEDIGACVVNLGFGDYADLFPSTSRDVLCRYPARETPRLATPKARRLLRGLARRAATAAERVPVVPPRFVQFFQSAGDTTFGKPLEERVAMTVNLDLPELRHAVQRAAVSVFRGPLVRGEDAMWRHRGLIREFFRPAPEAEARARGVLADARAGHDLVVGVHIRRGDYAHFEGGKFFFEFEQYADVMRRLAAANPGRSIGFVVCANDTVPLAAFQGLSIALGPGDVVADLEALASCDALVGPPSTFSAWASFTGGIPLCFIADPALDPTWDKFTVTGAPPGEAQRVLAAQGLL